MPVSSSSIDLSGLPEDIQGKFRYLTSLLRHYGSAVIGYSGGVDSVFLTHACHIVLGPRQYIACIAVSPSLAGRELDGAIKNADALGFRTESFQSTEMDDPEYVKNDSKRCFYCKSNLFGHLEKFRKKHGFSTILYGGNQDDLGDYRPGHDAAEKFGAKAPMAEAKLTKQDIRVLSRHFGLPTADKPSMPCLSSRLPYGSPVTENALQKVEKGEDVLAAAGFSNFRIRYEDETARIEIPPDEITLFSDAGKRKNIVAGIKEAGFKKVVLDLEGFRSGSLNEGIELNRS